MFKTAAGKAAFAACYDVALAKWPVPFTTMYIPSRFGNTHVIAQGPEDGPPLVLLHAAGTGSPVWIRNIAALSETYRTYLVDIVGDANKSEWLLPFRTRADYAAWLSDVLDGLRLERTHLGGMSFGGWQSLNFALTAPERVESLTLIAPAASFTKFRFSFFIRFFFPMLFPSRERLHNVLRWLSADRQVVDERLADQMFLGVQHFRFPKGGAFPSVFSDEELRQVTVPTLLLIGEQEAIYDPRAALSRARQLVPGIQAELVANTGHLLIMEKPEMINQRIVSFLASVEG